jgi:uncharacterized repeat protein (TIGR03833 family)
MPRRNQQHRERDNHRRRNDNNRNPPHDGNSNAGLIGTSVSVIQKQDQPTGRLTQGIVAEILTNSAFHPRGIKVRLADGRVGRISSGQPRGATTVEDISSNYLLESDHNDARRSAPSLADFMVGVAGPTRPATPIATSEWACSVCTFVNSGLLPECEMCQTSR